MGVGAAIGFVGERLDSWLLFLVSRLIAIASAVGAISALFKLSWFRQPSFRVSHLVIVEGSCLYVRDVMVSSFRLYPPEQPLLFNEP